MIFSKSLLDSIMILQQLDIILHIQKQFNLLSVFIIYFGLQRSMKKAAFYFLVLLGLLVLSFSSGVLNFNDQNFNSTIATNKYVLVKFFAPWCAHCKSMAAEYQKITEFFKEDQVVVGQLDATISTDTAHQYNIQSYPTIKFFVNGLHFDYKGQRSASMMYEWIKKKLENVIQIISQQKINQLRANQNFFVYFGSNEQKRKIIDFLNLAEDTVDYFTSPSQEDKLLFYQVGKDVIQYPSTHSFTDDQIKSWTISQTIPTVVPLQSKEYLDWVFYDVPTMKDVVMLLKQNDITQDGYKNFESICEINKEIFKCCFVDQRHQVFEGVKNYLKSKGISILALTRDALKQAYAYPNDINQLTEQSWKQFMAKAKAGQFSNLVISQKERIEYQNVKLLTEANFTSFIQKNRVVFVEFYSPTCPHCIQFAKVYEELAKKVYADKQLDYEIAAVNVQYNKNIGFDMKIQSLPTLILFLDGEKLSYRGQRTDQNILNFIKNVQNSKPITASSIAEVASPSVIIYDPAETTSLKFLPALFTRYPVYHVREGRQLKVVLRQKNQEIYVGQNSLEDINYWLYRKTDPILINLLNTNVDNKLRETLQNKIHILGLIDVQPQFSQSLRNILEHYCKGSELACGYAKKGESIFQQFIAWLGIKPNTTSFVYINTEKFDRYLFPGKLSQLNSEAINQFIADVKANKIMRITEAKNNFQRDKQTAKDEKEQKTKNVDQINQNDSKQSEDSEVTQKEQSQQQL